MTEHEVMPEGGDSSEPELELGTLLQNDLDEGPVGIFSTWRSVYLTVIVYSLATVVLLYLASVAMDFSAK